MFITGVDVKCFVDVAVVDEVFNGSVDGGDVSVELVFIIVDVGDSVLVSFMLCVRGE